MTVEASKRYALAEFVLDVDKRLLLRADAPVKLAHRPFQVLLYLIEQRERMVSRAELLERFWAGREVYDVSLSKCIGAIRKALGDTVEQPRFIETRWTDGYRYIGPVAELPAVQSTDARPVWLAVERLRGVSVVVEEETETAGVSAEAAALPVQTALLPGQPRRLRPVWAGGLLALLLLTGAGLFTWRNQRQAVLAEPPAAPIRSLAVLPLKHLSNEAGREFFSDGVTETLINELAKIHGLKVISRSSVFAFKGRDPDPRDVGRQLDVAAVLEGSVRQDAGMVRVAVRLVSATDGRVLWASETYRRPLKEILAVEEEIGCSIAENLRVRLCDAQPPVARPATHSFEAYEAYLRGRFYLNQRTSAGLKQAISYFQQALALDARYGLAAVGLADAYNLSLWAPDPPVEALAQARAAALHALELDASSAEAHAILGTIYRSNWEWAAEERAFEQALRLSTNAARVHHSAAYFYAVRGRMDEALAQIKRARELDPLNLALSADVAHLLYYARRPDEAIAQCRRTLELEPQFESARTHLLLAQLQKGEYQTVITSAQAALHQGEPKEFILAYAYAASGQNAAARQVLEAVRQRADKSPFSPVLFAQGYAGLGDRERAFAWLEQAYRQRAPLLVSFKVDPLFDPLRADPRYAELLRRVGL